MPFSDDELQSLYGNMSNVDYQTPAPPSLPDETAQGQQSTVPWKFPKQIANIVPAAINSLASGAVGLGQMLQSNPTSDADLAGIKSPLPTFDVGATKTIPDLILNKVAPEVAGWMLPYEGALKGITALGNVGKFAELPLAARIIGEGLAQGGANAITSPTAQDATQTGAMGLASGVLQQALPRWQRLLPLAGVSYLGTGGSAVDTALNTAMNMIPGFHGDINVTQPRFNPDTGFELNPQTPSSPIQSPQPASDLTGVDTTGLQLRRNDLEPTNFVKQLMQNPPTPTNGGLAFDPNAPDTSNLRLTDFGTSSPQVPIDTTPSGLSLAQPLPEVGNSGLQLDRSGNPLTPQFESQPQSLSGLNLEGAKLQQPEFPLVNLQSQGTDPNINFKLIENPELAGVPQSPEDAPLFNWRNEAIKQPAPLMLEDKAPTLESPQIDNPFASIRNPDVNLTPTNPFPVETQTQVGDLINQLGTKTPESEVPSSPVETATPKSKGVTTDQIQQAVAKITAKTGFPDVAVSDIAKELKLRNVDNLHQKLYDLQNQGKIDRLGQGDWSLSTKEQRKWAIPRQGSPEENPNVFVHFKEEAPEPPQVMTPAGDLTTLPTRMEGPHIISTVLDEGDGQYLSGDTWNAPHQKGEGNIFQTQIENVAAPENIKSAFLIQDENGVQRVTQDRLEAAKIAEAAGQRKSETIGSGPLQSEDLQDALPKTEVDPPAPQQILQKEKVSDAQDLTSAKVIQDKIDNHLAEIQNAKEEMKETGDPSFAAEIRARQMEVSKLRKMQQGSISPEAAIVLATAGIGGLIAYQQSKGDIGATLAGAIIVGGLGLLGIKALKDFKLKVGPEANLSNAKTIKQFVKATSETKAGMAVGGRGGIIANSARTAEQMLGFGSEFFRDSEIRASGWVQDQVNQLQAEFNKVKSHQPTSGFLDAAKSFFRGQLANGADVQRILDNGGVSEADYASLSSVDKTAYPEKWITVNDPNSTNYKGNVSEVYHVSNDTKSQLKQLQSQALLRSVGSNADKEMIPFFQKAYDTRDTMMQMMHSALPPGEFRNKVIGTSGQYSTRSFDAIFDPNYYPTEEAIQNRMSEISSNMEGRFLDRYGSDTSRPGSIPIQDSTGKTSYIDPNQKIEWDNLHTPESLRAYVRQEISDIKQAGSQWKGSSVSSDDIQYNGGLFTGRKELTDAALTLYGERTNAFQNINDTISKLSPLTRSSIQMKNLAGQVEATTGLKYAYSDSIDFNKEVNGIKDQLRTDPNNKLLHTKLAELQSYQPLSNQNPKFGMFQGAMVSRRAYDSINGIEGGMGALDGTFGKAMMNFNQLVKDTHLTANPITQVRNMLQIPMFLAMGNAATSFDHMMTVGKMLWHGDFSSSVARELVQQGCFEGNPVVAEFKRSLNDLVTGKADQDIATTLIHKGWDMAQKLYAYPDNFVRGVTYLAARERAMDKIGMGLEDFENVTSGKLVNDKLLAKANSVKDDARNFMSRRTLDYGAAPQIVKIGRQIPFVSMYLTYTQQIMKIAKNMAVDAVGGDFQAGATLATFGSIPFVAQHIAESQLNPTDKAAWDQTQKVVQAYSRPRFKLPLSRNSDGSFNYLDITALSHFNDFQMMARAVKSGDWKSFFAVNPLVSTDNTPLISLASDQIQGKDSHTNRVFRNGEIQNIGDRAMNIAKEILPPWVPGIGYDWEKSMPESLGGNLGVTNYANARTETIQGALIRHVLGADYTQISPGIAMKNFVNETKTNIANEKQYLMDVLKSNISDDAKKRATQKFVEAVGVLTQNMQARLQSN